MNIYEKLDKARELVRSTKHKKAGRNEYSNFDYYTPEQVEMIVAEVCKETKMLPLCHLKRDEFGLVQHLQLVDMEKVEDVLGFELATVQGEMKATNATQQMGGTDTYSERYIKMKVFQIKDNNLDPDGHDNGKAVGKKAEVNNDFQI